MERANWIECMFVTITIQTYNNAEILGQVLQSLGELQCPDDADYEILVVDNNSDDVTAAVVEHSRFALGSRLRYVFESNQGLSHARNRAIAEARGEIICFLDDDALADGNWLTGHVEAYREDEQTVAVGGRVLLQWPSGWSRPAWLSSDLDGYLSGVDLGQDRQVMHYPRYPYGCNMSVRRPIAEQIEGFSVRLGRKKGSLISNEEKHFFHKIHQMGGQVMYTPDALVHHMVPATRLKRRFFLRRGYAQGISNVIFQTEIDPTKRTFLWHLRQCAVGVTLFGGALARTAVSCFSRCARSAVFSGVVRAVYGLGYMVGAAQGARQAIWGSKQALATSPPDEDGAVATHDRSGHATPSPVMNAQGSQHVVFAPYWGKANPYQDALAEHLSASGVEVEKVRSLKALFRWGVFLNHVPDVVHLHWLPVFGWRGLLAFRCLAFVARLVLLRLRGVRIIWTVHNLLPHESRHRRMDWLLARAVVGVSDTLIVHSETAQREVARMWKIKDCSRIVVVPHAHYIDQYRNDVSQAEAREWLGIPESKIVLLFLGAVRPYKGVMPLIEAFKALGDERTYLLIAGRPLDEAFSQSVQQAVSACENARFTPGFVADEDVQVYMNACDVVVLPYRKTLSSGAALLAMSFGRACVAPSQGSLSDVLDPAGAFLYDPETEEGLLDALRRVAGGAEQLAQMGSHNRQRVSHWTWADMARATAQLYERSVTGVHEAEPVGEHAVNEKLS